MASTGKCQYCGATLLSSDPVCPQCGAPNPHYVKPEQTHQIFDPKTIEELKQYCAERGMPLLKMRFFIGEDYKEPRAFGIYQDGSDFVVYKNKDDGTRAIRYQGPDEEHAVSELYEKLLDECHNRGIYPDGDTEKGVRTANSRFKQKIISLVVMVAAVLYFFGSCIYGAVAHRKDGYYQFAEDAPIYYHYGDDWFIGSGSDWISTSEPTYEGNSSQYYLGEDYSSDWGVSDFKESDTYERISESSSSSDYSSWNSSDTNWSSDW
jgi:hypothetical protein